MAKIYVGAIGLVFIVKTGVDLSTMTLAKFKVKKPDNSEVEWNANVWGNAKEW